MVFTNNYEREHDNFLKNAFCTRTKNLHRKSISKFTRPYNYSRAECDDFAVVK